MENASNAVVSAKGTRGNIIEKYAQRERTCIWKHVREVRGTSGRRGPRPNLYVNSTNKRFPEWLQVTRNEIGTRSRSFLVRPSLSIPEREVPRRTDEVHVRADRHMGNSGNPVIITCRTPLRHAWNLAVQPAYGVGPRWKMTAVAWLRHARSLSIDFFSFE